MNGIFYKLYTGTISINGAKHKYAITIDYVQPPVGERRNFDAYTAKMSVADSNKDIVDAFEREYDTRFGGWTPEGIKLNMTHECLENFK